MVVWVFVSELLLDEVDRLTGGQPERRRRCAEGRAACGSREGGVAQRDVVATAADVVAVQLAPGRAREHERPDSFLAGLVSAMGAQDVQKVPGDHDVTGLIAYRGAGATDLHGP